MYPGMLNDQTEFFKLDEKLLYICNGVVDAFENLPSLKLQMIEEEINADKMAKNELERLFPNQKSKQIEKFASCRFGGLDHTGDLINGKFQESEYVKCPLRGNCKSEGILCKSFSINGQILSNTEIEIWKESATNKTNEVIAEDLNLCLGTFHKIKQAFYDKLGNIQTKQETTALGFFHGIF